MGVGETHEKNLVLMPMLAHEQGVRLVDVMIDTVRGVDGGQEQEKFPSVVPQLGLCSRLNRMVVCYRRA